MAFLLAHLAVTIDGGVHPLGKLVDLLLLLARVLLHVAPIVVVDVVDDDLARQFEMFLEHIH
jgi:hypothetical protein